MKTILIVSLFALSIPAYGYVDPGSGQMLWQLFLAAFIGSFFYVGKAFDFVRRILGRGRRIQ